MWWLPKGAHAAQVVEAAVPAEVETPLDPVEQIEQGIARIHADVAAELLTRLHAQAPTFLEQAVLDLLLAMGYGGAEGRATRTQLTSDGGIDGIIDQDALGLSRIYVQAKRYELGSTSSGRRSRRSWAHCTAMLPGTASSSRQAASVPARRTTRRASRPASCSSTDSAWRRS